MDNTTLKIWKAELNDMSNKHLALELINRCDGTYNELILREAIARILIRD